MLLNNVSKTPLLNSYLYILFDERDNRSAGKNAAQVSGQRGFP